MGVGFRQAFVWVVGGWVQLLGAWALGEGATLPVPAVWGRGERPVVCVYTDVLPRLQVIVAAWEDGRVVWSENRVDGGRPYHEAMRSPAEVKRVLDDASAGRLLAASDVVCGGRDYSTSACETHFHLVIDGASKVDYTRHLRLEAHTARVYTSRGPEELAGRTTAEVLKGEPECHLSYRARMEELNALCLGLITGDDGGVPVADVGFEMRFPGGESAYRSAGDSEPVGRWVSSSTTPVYRLRASFRDDDPLIWIAVGSDEYPGGASCEEALYEDGTLVWCSDPIDSEKPRRNYEMARLEPGEARDVLQRLYRQNVFCEAVMAQPRAYTPAFWHMASMTDVHGAVRQVKSSHVLRSVGDRYFRIGYDGVFDHDLRKSREEWLRGQPLAYRHFLDDWDRTGVLLKSLRPEDASRIEVLSRVEWKLEAAP